LCRAVHVRVERVHLACTIAQRSVLETCGVERRATQDIPPSIERALDQGHRPDRPLPDGGYPRSACSGGSIAPARARGGTLRIQRGTAPIVRSALDAARFQNGSLCDGASKVDTFHTNVHGTAQLLRLRLGLASWLDRQDVARASRDAVVLATHEAVVNALEHRRGDTEIPISAKIENRLVTVVVQNTGRWGEPHSPDEERGRGIAMIKALMTRTQIRNDDDQTTAVMQLRL
jgi:anti-sigma regulatory factor (Ser/Thr protein kinase)